MKRPDGDEGSLNLCSDWILYADELEARLGRAARQLEAIAFNAESHHAGEDGCRRALAVIAQWARDAESVPDGVGAVLVEQEKPS